MATITAAATGNWSATGTWVGGVVPGPGDVAEAGGFTVTLDVNVTCTSLTNTAGGGFTSSASGRTINANIEARTGADGLVLSGSGSTVIVGNISGGTASNIDGVVTTGSHALTVTGNVTGGSGSTAYGINFASTGTLTVTGAVTGGSTTNANGITSSTASSMTITGNVTGGSGAGASGILTFSAVNMTINGNVTGGSGASHGIFTSTSGTVTIPSPYTCTASGTGHGLHITGATTKATIFAAVGNDMGVGSGHGKFFGATFDTTPTTGFLKVRKLVFGNKGATPVTGPVYFDDVANFQVLGRDSTLTEYTFDAVTASQSGKLIGIGGGLIG